MRIEEKKNEINYHYSESRATVVAIRIKDHQNFPFPALNFAFIR